MDDKGREKLHSAPSPLEKPKVESGQEKSKVSREAAEKAAGVLDGSRTEASGDAQEDAEGGLGRVSEEAGENQDMAQQSSGKAGKSLTDDEIEAIRAKLLAAAPSLAVMVKQIKKKLYKEEKELTKKMKKYQKKAHINAFHLAVVVTQLRKVREYFSILAHATFEAVKHLWLKIVHGV